MKTIYWVLNYETIRDFDIIFETELNYLGKSQKTGSEYLFQKDQKDNDWHSTLENAEKEMAIKKQIEELKKLLK